MTPRPRSRHRELTDFLAFALAIVFLVRTFVGEPYGVPTGSMAPTLLGAHKLIRCLACGKEFPVGVLEGSSPVVCRCPACETTLDIADAPTKSGNRIIVLKGPPKPLRRWDVAVFKFIDEPRKLYVKRIVGLPGERLRIKAGEIEIWNESEQCWRIARKPAELAKELAIPVWEQEYQKEGRSEAWSSTPKDSWLRDHDGWTSFGVRALSFRYPTPEGGSRLIGDDLAYNLGLTSTQAANAASYWNKASDPVGDLHVAMTVQSLGQWPKVHVEFHRGGRTYKLKFGDASINLVVDGHEVAEWSRHSAPQRFRLRCAYVDQRILVWMDEKLVVEWMDDGPEIDLYPLDYASRPGQSLSGDLQPISIRSIGDSVKLTEVQVLRDLYHTQDVGLVDFLPDGSGRDLMGNVREFKRFRDGRMRTKEFTVGPYQYFALGDNSEQSLDGRHWKHGHFVDERMIVGRVLFKLGR